jgi:hypothetical protein
VERDQATGAAGVVGGAEGGVDCRRPGVTRHPHGLAKLPQLAEMTTSSGPLGSGCAARGPKLTGRAPAGTTRQCASAKLLKRVAARKARFRHRRRQGAALSDGSAARRRTAGGRNRDSEPWLALDPRLDRTGVREALSGDANAVGRPQRGGLREASPAVSGRPLVAGKIVMKQRTGCEDQQVRLAQQDRNGRRAAWAVKPRTGNRPGSLRPQGGAATAGAQLARAAMRGTLRRRRPRSEARRSSCRAKAGVPSSRPAPNGPGS